VIRRRAVETDANCGTANSHHERRATEGPRFIAARFGVSNFDGSVRVVVVGVSVKAASYSSGLRMANPAMIPSGWCTSL
jgi:hypothetical protein